MLPATMFDSVLPANVLEGVKRYVAIDLSVGNSVIEELETSEEYSHFINEFLQTNKADAAYGGYNEVRNLYKRSEIFNDEEQPRNVHIGLDLWAPAGTPVLSALEGEIHSFNYNTGIGNYGPTIIIRHAIGRETFYALYGHLDLESLEEIEIGQKVARGEIIGQLGSSRENGDYAPHLHFQLILDIGSHFGDFPGVCSAAELQHYLNNCPDPNLLLKINV